MKALSIAALATFIVGTVLAPAFADVNPEALIEQQHYRRAQKVLEEQLRRNPKDMKALELMGRIKLLTNQSADLMKMMEPLVAQYPQNAEFHALLGDADGEEAGSPNAGMFQRMHLGRAMKKEGEAALALDPKNIDALEGMTHFYEEAPGIAGGDKKKAQEYADRLIAIDPVFGYLLKAELAANEKQEDKIENLYQQALAASPKSYLALATLGLFYGAEKHRDFDKSDKYLQQALQIDPGRSLAYAILAQTLVVREKWNDLDQLLVQAEKACPDDFNYYFQAGRVLLNGKDNARAERYFRKYLTQEPELGRADWAHAHWRLGLVLEKEGKKDEARQEVETALKLKPDLKAAEKDLKRIKS